VSVVRAEGLGARSRRGWLFRHVDLDVDAGGQVVALTGPSGSGRTSLLLALAGRFATNEGSVRRDGRAALGHVPRVHEPEPTLTVAEHLEERLLLLGGDRPARSRLVPAARRREVRQLRRDRAAAALAPYAEDLDPAARGRDLTPYQRQLLGLALATLDHPALVLVDDVDAGLDAGERSRIWTTLHDLAGSGPAVIAAGREPDPTLRATRYQMGQS
jgi:ABC-2 type transport system ATP-binding protein